MRQEAPTSPLERATNVQILVIGRPGQIFTQPAQIRQLDVCEDIQAGLDALVGGRYGVVALQMTGLEGRLGQVIKDLRDRTDARLVLLARIYEEPIAIRYRGEPGKEGADDYLLYPLSVESLIEACQGSEGKAQPQTWPVLPGADLATRIRILERLATEDDLTGLKNRRYVWEFARQLIGRSGAAPIRMTVLLFDIDDFKHYNDTYGHATGDRILVEIGSLIRRCCRPHDVVGRLGGDEFAVIVWDDPAMGRKGHMPERRASTSVHPREVMAIAKRFTEAIGRSDWSSIGPRGKGVLTVSGGLASFPDDAKTVEELFNRADAALMEAKRTGRNRIVLVGQIGNTQPGPNAK